MFKGLLAEEFAPYGVLSELQLSQLEAHYDALSRWNARLNLTRIRDLEDSVKFHYCESLFLARFIPTGSHRIVDIGSGAGFPGIPVAILRPECELSLVESHQRKAVFLRECTRSLPNVRVLPQRAEEVHDTFDWLISRAVTPSDVLKLRLSSNVSLLMGSGDAPELEGRIEPLPWGNNRVLFHVERTM
jgi:16S rRNA (guanine527-N7)-methyltransferase